MWGFRPLVSDHLWIDENLNPFNIIINGLVGFKPSLDSTFIIHPLIPDTWDWFCLDHVSYKGKIITILWDKTGKKYHRGKGLRVFADGKLLKASVDINSRGSLYRF